jgi:predicted alpha/beta superfamily hydrolase
VKSKNHLYGKAFFAGATALSLLFSCTQNLPASGTQSLQALEAPRQHTIEGNVNYHTIKTKFLSSGKRDLVVYLPPSYNSNPTQKYPVLYMQDGQNIFDQATGAFGKEWYIDEKVEYLIKKKVIREIIIVGVYNGLDKRIDEYTWNPMPGEGGGGGRSYGEFLTREVKPFIDKTYRTKSGRADTAVAGSSLGGLISFYLAARYPAVFSKIGAMSPSFWWNNGEAFQEVPALKDSFDFWLDCGSREGDNPDTMINYVNRMYSQLNGKFGPDHVYRYIQENAAHNEEAWATRIHGPLIQFFGTEPDPAKKSALIKRLMILEEWGKL